MSAHRKLKVLRAAEDSDLPAREALARLELAPSTYFRLRRCFRKDGVEGLHDRLPHKGRIWNQLLPRERAKLKGRIMAKRIWHNVTNPRPRGPKP